MRPTSGSPGTCGGSLNQINGARPLIPNEWVTGVYSRGVQESET